MKDKINCNNFKIMKYFMSGNIVYGVYYTFNRVIRRMHVYLNKYVHKKSLFYCGENVTFGKNLFIINPRSVSIGNNVHIGDDCEITTEIDTAKLIIEDGVRIVGKCKIDYSGGIMIGRNTLLSPGVKIITHDHGRDPYSKPIGKNLVIGENVWLGMDSLIMPNVGEIGENSIVGASAIVVKNVPKDSMVYASLGKVKKKYE